VRHWKPDFIITVIWGLGSMIGLVLMGMEVIHNQQVVDKLLLTIPGGTAIIMGYWFSKGKDSSGDPPK
jgi:hypothetical protein